MRQILFKAKRIDNGEWVEGGYVNRTDCYDIECDEHYIIDGTITDMEGYCKHYLVDADTICQYTGLTDKNGNKIWENDIIRHYNKRWEPNVYTEGIIKWNAFECRFENQSTKNPCNTYTINPMCNYEVIGNIFDNADLVKE